MTRFTYMAIKVADEDQFNAVAQKLRGMGYEADADPLFCKWQKHLANCDAHVLTYSDGEFSLHGHRGGTLDYTRYTFTQFMEL